MRTTLYLSAALAAMSFNLGASAVSLAPTELNQETALAQTYLDADISLESETGIMRRIPKNWDEFLNMVKFGTTLLPENEEALRKAVVEILREGAASDTGRGRVIDDNDTWRKLCDKLYRFHGPHLDKFVIEA